MNAAATLTKRETEIAEMIAWGATKKDIARLLFISERTVENTARSIYEKTGVTKSNELSAWWFCTRFKISFNLSPFARKSMAIVLLLFLLPRELLTHNNVTFRTRTNRTECRTLRQVRRRTKDYLLNI